MDLKKKIKSFVKDIRESAAKSPEEELLPAQLTVSPAVAKFKEHINKLQNDPEADREAITQIEEPYYQDPSFDASQHELQRLPEASNLVEIDADRGRLARQLEAVSRKVSELVLENHPAYVQELDRVMDLERSLNNASAICANGRRQLGLAKKGFTTASLGLLHNYRKRQQLIALLKSLRTIRTLQTTDIKLREMLDKEDYPGAIQLCLECQKAASTFRHYKCISELSSKLQDTLEMIEESLDVALSKTCATFDHNHYGRIQTAYRLLGKVQTSMDQLHMHFTSAIHNTAFTIVLGYVELAAGTGDSSNQKRQYADLCKHMPVEMFTPCLIDLCKALWEVMKSYHKTIKWHQDNDMEPDANTSATSWQGEEGCTAAADFDRRYIQQKLEHGLVRIYSDVQQKVKVYMLSTDISYFKYDEFIQVLDIVNRLIQIGEEFCGSKSEALQDSIRKQSLRYFRNYHRTRMDELRMFLENEGWELCPVKSSFSITQLQEFKYMKGLAERQRGQEADNGSSPSEQTKADCVDDTIHHNYDYFARYGEVGSPFDAQITEEQEEDLMETNGFSDDSGLPRTLSQDSDSDEDIPEELKQEYIDENTGDTPPPLSQRKDRRLSILRTKRRSGTISSTKASPIITNTTLNVCRLFGKYMQMMNVLKPIAFDVILCMSELFDYYLYAIYGFFASDLDMILQVYNKHRWLEDMKNEVNETSLSSKLRTTLRRIQDNLILNEQDGSPVSAPPGVGPPSGGLEDKHDKIGHPHISPIVDLGGIDKLFGLTERVVATESLVFLAEQFEFLQPQLKAMIPPTKKAFLQQFYAQTVSTAQELRKPVHRTIAARAIDYDKLLVLMASVRWDIRDIMSQHSHYVDVLLQEFEAFDNRLLTIGRRVPVPKVVTSVLWEHCIRLANRTFVEGYASAKKCTNEGRALMQLDFQQFLVKLEKLTDLRPIPDREHVEAYIKAYYLPEAQLDMWIRDHKEYSSKQLVALVTCIAHINRKGRQKLLALIEELEKTRR